MNGPNPCRRRRPLSRPTVRVRSDVVVARCSHRRFSQRAGDSCLRPTPKLAGRDFEMTAQIVDVFLRAKPDIAYCFSNSGSVSPVRAMSTIRLASKFRVELSFSTCGATLNKSAYASSRTAANLGKSNNVPTNSLQWLARRERRYIRTYSHRSSVDAGASEGAHCAKCRFAILLFTKALTAPANS